jgi:hypothetical protein
MPHRLVFDDVLGSCVLCRESGQPGLMLGDLSIAVAIGRGEPGTVTRLFFGLCRGSQRGTPHAAEITATTRDALSGTKFLVQGRNRTTDTVIFSHVIYQLSYLGAARGADDRTAIESGRDRDIRGPQGGDRSARDRAQGAGRVLKRNGQAVGRAWPFRTIIPREGTLRSWAAQCGGTVAGCRGAPSATPPACAMRACRQRAPRLRPAGFRVSFGLAARGECGGMGVRLILSCSSALLVAALLQTATQPAHALTIRDLATRDSCGCR